MPNLKRCVERVALNDDRILSFEVEGNKASIVLTKNNSTTKGFARYFFDENGEFTWQSDSNRPYVVAFIGNEIRKEIRFDVPTLDM